VFVEAGVDGASVDALHADGGLGRFVRSLVGLERDASGQRIHSRLHFGQPLFDKVALKICESGFKQPAISADAIKMHAQAG
jgi:hypothetical protein